MKLDLNAERAARAEARGDEDNTVELGTDDKGKPLEWRLKSEMPINVVSLLTAGNLEAAWRAMLADPNDFDHMVKLGVDPSTDDLMLLVQSMAGTALGNS